MKKNAKKSAPISPQTQALLPENTLQIAMQQQQTGNFAQAELLYRQILQTQPDHIDVLYFLGVLMFQTARATAAVELLSQAVSFPTATAPMFFHLGLVQHSLGLLDAASANYAAALTLQPDYVEAYYNLGSVFLGQNNPEKALKMYRLAIFFNPDAATQIQQSLAQLLTAQGASPQTIADTQQQLAFRPEDIVSYYNLGVSYYNQGRFELATRCFNALLIIKPDHAAVYCNLADLLHIQRKLEQAIDYYKKSLSLDPNHIEAIDMLLFTQLHCCDWSNYASSRERINADVTAGVAGYNPFSFIAISAAMSAQQQAARCFVEKYYPAVQPPLCAKYPYQREKIRLAYVSADFCDHAVSYLMAGLFEQHDRKRFEIIAISLQPEQHSAMGQRVKAAFAQFIDVSQRSDQDVAQLMRELEIDIAVDLMGFTGQQSRTGIFSFRPAPLQINYLGYPSTMGASYIDYIIADQQVIPAHQQGDYSEKVVYLPDVFMPSDDKRVIAKPPATRIAAGLPESGFVFCCFNNHYKINPEVFTVWMRLLKKLPNSVLWLSSTHEFAMANLRKEARLRGISAERIIFAPKLPNIADHLARQKWADLFLDTQPYNAHTTASDALWAGLPLITCMGNTFASRVAGSLLHAIDLPELITENLADYENLAFKLATSPVLLAEIREKLVQNRLTYPLFNTDRFRRHLEAAYLTMWEQHQRGEAPVSFSVAATE